MLTASSTTRDESDVRDLSVPIATETSARTNHSRRRRTRRTQTRQHCSREGTREKRFNHSSSCSGLLSAPSSCPGLSLFPPLLLSRCLALFFPQTLPKRPKTSHIAQSSALLLLSSLSLSLSLLCLCLDVDGQERPNLDLLSQLLTSYLPSAAPSPLAVHPGSTEFLPTLAALL